MDIYLAPDSTFCDSVALNPIADETWSEFDFSLFELDSDDDLTQLDDTNQKKDEDH